MQSVRLKANNYANNNNNNKHSTLGDNVVSHGGIG